MLWVSRLSSAGIHVPIISSMRIIVLRKVGGIQSEHNFPDFIQWGPSICPPLVLGVSVLHLTIMSPVSESWHMSSLVPGRLYDPFIRLISLFVSHAGLNVWDDVSSQPIRGQDFRFPPMRRRVGWLVRCQSDPPLSFVRLSAASRPHPSPATRNKTSTWLIDDTTRKGGIHMEQEDFHGAQRRYIYEGWRCFGYSWLLLALDILTWHLEMPRISWEGLEELEEGRMEIMGQYFMPGLHRNINPGCHCKNKQGHCLHFIAIFLRLQFSWHTIELWIKERSLF